MYGKKKSKGEMGKAITKQKGTKVKVTKKKKKSYGK